MRNGKYVLVFAPQEYAGMRYRDKYCYEHHLVWWKHYNDVIAKDYVIHHINGNTHDNRIENLQKMLRVLHSKHHSRVKVFIEYTCKNCGIVFKRRKGATGIFCSRKCIGLYNYPRKMRNSSMVE